MPIRRFNRKKGVGMSDFNFDQWAQLYRDNPAAFEVEREKLLTGLIAESKLSEQQRAELKAKLFDPARAQQDPMTAIQTSQKLMWDSVDSLQAQMQSLHTAVVSQTHVRSNLPAVELFTR
jgi:hypothetical protein